MIVHYTESQKLHNQIYLIDTASSMLSWRILSYLHWPAMLDTWLQSKYFTHNTFESFLVMWELHWFQFCRKYQVGCSYQESIRYILNFLWKASWIHRHSWASCEADISSGQESPIWSWRSARHHLLWWTASSWPIWLFWETLSPEMQVLC